jgi:hypothetical protein
MRIPGLPGRSSLALALALGVVTSSGTRAAEAVEGPEASGAGAPARPTLMRLLHDRGLHDLEEERWNAYGQLTYVSSWKPSFQAPYTNLGGSTNSLVPEAERSFTASATLFLGLRLWPGAEAYFVPEVIAERPLSQLRGLGGAIQNFELQKTGGESPQLYRSRLYLRQTLGLGGGTLPRDSDQMQLGGRVDRRRITLTAGNFSVLDFFDRNALTSDPRQQFLNMGFMTHAAWDFAADARGYSWGAAVELAWDAWAVRFARMAPPADPNQLPLTFRLDRLYGDSLELEHQHDLAGQPGTVRVLAFRNRENMGRFDEAIAVFRADPGRNAAACTAFNFGSRNAGAPDLCWVRRPNVKAGIGVGVEQSVTSDAGVFARALYADGETEVQAYTSADRSISFGGTSRGSPWGRPRDLAGAGLAVAWISSAHADYLRLGGMDGFIGDGSLRAAPEAVVELFYSVSLLEAASVTLDVQRIWNPGFNADRGPVDVFGLRLHARF